MACMHASRHIQNTMADNANQHADPPCPLQDDNSLRVWHEKIIPLARSADAVGRAARTAKADEETMAANRRYPTREGRGIDEFSRVSSIPMPADELNPNCPLDDPQTVRFWEEKIWPLCRKAANGRRDARFNTGGRAIPTTAVYPGHNVQIHPRRRRRDDNK